jgi:hypothetical protein
MPSRSRRDSLIAIGLYVLTLLIYARSVSAVATVQVLTGEEASVSIRDVMFTVEERVQATVWSTNFFGPVYYWIASHLDPYYSLFSARRWKAAVIALLAPLVFLTLRRRLGCGYTPAAVGGGTVALIPGVAMFGWLATENGLEAVWGMAGLLLATARRRGWQVAPVFGGLAITTYTAGAAWAAGIGLAVLVRALSSERRWRDLALVAGAAATALGVVLFPRLWWTVGERIVAGGGTLQLEIMPGNLAELGRMLTRDGTSYYYFAALPALGSLWLALAAGAALVAALVTRPRIWPWVVVVVVTVVVYVPSGNVPGVRRTVALAVVAALALAVAVDLLASALAGGKRPALARAAVVGAAAAILVPLGVGLADWQDGFARGVPARALAIDFPFPLRSGASMPETLDYLTEQLRSERMDAEEVAATWEGERTLAIVRLLAERRGESTTGLPTAEEITALLFEGPRCYQQCTSVPGRP